MAFNIRQDWYHEPISAQQFITQKYSPDEENIKAVVSLINHSIFYGYFSNQEKMQKEREILQGVADAAANNEPVLDKLGAGALEHHHTSELMRSDFFDDYKMKISYMILNNKCEVNCIDCGNFSYPKGTRNLDFEALENFIAKNKEIIAHNPISLSGGEVLEYASKNKDVSDVIALLFSAGIHEGIFSTGGISKNNLEKRNVLKKMYAEAEKLNFDLEAAISFHPFYPGVLSNNGEINADAFESYKDMIYETVKYMKEYTDRIHTVIRYPQRHAIKMQLESGMREISAMHADVQFEYLPRETVSLGRAAHLHRTAGISAADCNICDIYLRPTGFSILPDGSITPCSSLNNIVKEKAMHISGDLNALPRIFNDYVDKKYDKMMELLKNNLNTEICNFC